MSIQNLSFKYFVLLSFAALLLNTQGHAQSAGRVISGTVTSEGTRLEGVLVSIKRSNYFSGTQPDGVFYIPVSVADSVLVFSLEGYEPQEVTLSARDEYNIELKKKSPPIYEIYNPSTLPGRRQWYSGYNSR
jgi:hypothetical protein